MAIQIQTQVCPQCSSLFITNAFSPSMLEDTRNLRFLLLSGGEEEARKVLHRLSVEVDFSPVSAVGHADTARLFTSLLGTPVPANRISVTLKMWDILLVGQYNGPRLPEGCTTLPEGASIRWWLIFDRDEYPDLW